MNARISLAGVVLALAVLGVGLAVYRSETVPPRQYVTAGPSQTNDVSERVTYKVTGSAARASLTYKNASGGTEQKNEGLPWTLTFDAPLGTILYVSAQKEGDDDSGMVVAKIYVETGLLQQAES